MSNEEQVASSGGESTTTEESQIESYFRGKSIFITGATGFLGKVLIEKLLRSCPDLKAIYVLVRGKKGKSPAERLNDIINSHGLFDRIKEMKIEYKSKLIAVEGDLLEPDLGISDKDRQELIHNVNVVFHSAATVRFDEPVKTAIQLNVIGTKKVIQLSKNFKHLEVFVHISTAFANCNEKCIIEEVIDPPMTPERAIEVVDFLDDANFDNLTQQIIKPRPNSYVYTKAIAENLVLKESSNIPCVIIRPSIVGASWQEPFPGWIDNFNGPTGLFQAFNMGVLRCMVGRREFTADIIPVDLCINMIIASAWYTGANKIDQLMVYNCTMDNSNRCTWGMIEDFGNICAALYPSPSSNILTPSFKFTTHQYLKPIKSRTVKCFVLQWVPAYFLDVGLKMFNKKPYLIRVQKKLMNAVKMLEHFTVMQLEFTQENTSMLLKQLNEKDHSQFQFDTKLLKWTDYMHAYYYGIKKYLVREDLSKLDQMRTNYKRMQVAKNVIFYGGLAVAANYIQSSISSWFF